MNKKILIIALFSLFACSNKNECKKWRILPIKINAVLEIEKDTINELNEALGDNVFSISSDGINIKYVDDAGFFKEGNCFVSCNFGIINFSAISIDKKILGTDKLKNLLAHEMFHSLGFLGHDWLHKSIMRVDAPKGDIKNLISKNMVDWLHSNYPSYRGQQ